MKNPLTWVGGKSRIADAIVEHMPLGPFVYHEPFAGALNVYFELHKRGRIETAFLSDTCKPLIDFWKAIKGSPYYFDTINIENSADRFAKERLKVGIDPVAFWYVNRCGFNGLWRTNKSGGCNVPWGHGTKPFETSRYDYHEASKRLASATITACDYETSIAIADDRSVIYCDPPYDGTFNGYDGTKSFDQRRLADALKSSGATWFLSSSDTLLIRELYSEFRFIPIVTRYSVAADGLSREVTELLITNHEVK
jgi:DNA adenine methylase